jgi:4-amino-4-deoxy-L-arabinose transferase-like glycosyltransferase
VTRRRLPWWAAVGLLAFAVRLAFIWAADGPLVFGHERVYFGKALWIAEHPTPWRFVLADDAWRSWAGPFWTLPPLYPLFLAAFVAVWGPSLAAVLVLQAALGALAAVGVGCLAREMEPAAGPWAGIGYAVFWPAVMTASTTMTENLHTVLLVWSLALLAIAGRSGSPRTAAAGGFLLGLSALTRTVSLLFVPLAVWAHLRAQGWRRGVRAALVIALGSAAAIAPWTARNVLGQGDPVLVDSVGVFNLWNDNLFVNEDRARMQQESIEAEPTPAARRARAVTLAMRNVTRAPEAIPVKVWDNTRFFFRPEALDSVLRVEYPHPGWLHAVWVVLGDALFLAALPLFAVFLVAGRPSPGRTLVWAWSAYYLFMLIVVFHAQLRYRSAWTPFLIAGAAAGLGVLHRSSAPRRARGALLAGLALAALTAWPYVPRAWHAARAALDLRAARAALARGGAEAAEPIVRRAAARDPAAGRPWMSYGRMLARGGHAAEAAEAYGQAARRSAGGHTTSLFVLPQLLREAGREVEAEAAAVRADAAARDFDAWWGLELAWRELPAPHADEVLLARGDFGAVRGCLDGRLKHRWTRGQAWVRLFPTHPAPAYAVTLEMGSPPPSPFANPTVMVAVSGSEPVRLTLGPEVRAYTVRAPATPGQPLLVEIRAPTWSRPQGPPEQGVRLDRVSVAPVDTAESGLHGRRGG